MVVCAHGDVERYCQEHGMVICDCYIGYLEDYEGVCRVVVTDQQMEENEFYGLKLRLLRKGVELISTRHSDEAMASFVSYLAAERRVKHGGRKQFGTGSEAEKAVVRRILELNDSGKNLREISEDESVSYLDGRKISISTIQLIIKNRKKYEEG